MARLIKSILFIAFLFGGAALSNAANKDVHRTHVYAELDLVKNTVTLGTWAFTIPPSKDPVVIKKIMNQSEIVETETVTLMSRTCIFSGIGVTSKEVFLKPLEEMEDGEKGIGHMEMADSKSGELLWKHPMVYRIRTNGTVTLAVFDVFMNDGKKMRIMREFMQAEPFAPTMERFTLIDVNGRITRDVIHSRRD